MRICLKAAPSLVRIRLTYNACARAVMEEVCEPRHSKMYQSIRGLQVEGPLVEKWMNVSGSKPSVVTEERSVGPMTSEGVGHITIGCHASITALHSITFYEPGCKRGVQAALQLPSGTAAWYCQ
jgi:hypothetical protein